MAKGFYRFIIIFIFIFTSVGLGFITKQVFDGTEIKTLSDIPYDYINVDLEHPGEIKSIPDPTTGVYKITPCYKQIEGKPLKTSMTVKAQTNLIGKLAIDLNTAELNTVKGSLILLWIILLVFTIACLMITFN